MKDHLEKHVLEDHYYEGKIPGESTFRNHDLRVIRYDVRDYASQIRNLVLVNFPQSQDRDNALQDLKRIVELVDSL